MTSGQRRLLRLHCLTLPSRLGRTTAIAVVVSMVMLKIGIGLDLRMCPALYIDCNSNSDANLKYNSLFIYIDVPDVYTNPCAKHSIKINQY